MARIWCLPYHNQRLRDPGGRRVYFGDMRSPDGGGLSVQGWARCEKLRPPSPATTGGCTWWRSVRTRQVASGGADRTVPLWEEGSETLSVLWLDAPVQALAWNRKAVVLGTVEFVVLVDVVTHE